MRRRGIPRLASRGRILIQGPPFRDACTTIAGGLRAARFRHLCMDGRRAEDIMKIRNSLKSLRGRHRDNQLVRRKGRVYVINKTQKRFKARQG